jgi:hypothetical protein
MERQLGGFHHHNGKPANCSYYTAVADGKRYQWLQRRLAGGQRRRNRVPFQWNPDSNTYGESIADADGNSDSYGAAKSYTDSYSDVYPNCYCYFHCNSYRDCHGDFHSHFHPNYDSTTNSDIYAYGYFDDYTKANAYAQAACNAEITTHRAAAPESVITGIGRQTSE